MDNKKPRYKDIHGTTRVGDWLRTLKNSKLLETIGQVLPDKGALGIVKNLVTKSEELTPEQREHALKLIELDLKDMDGVTKRWESDMASDNKLSKNVRPMTLIFLTLATAGFIVLDSSGVNFNVDKEWIDLLKVLLSAVYVAYFGGRSWEKTKKL